MSRQGKVEEAEDRTEARTRTETKDRTKAEEDKGEEERNQKEGTSPVLELCRRHRRKAESR